MVAIMVNLLYILQQVSKTVYMSNKQARVVILYTENNFIPM